MNKYIIALILFILTTNSILSQAIAFKWKESCMGYRNTLNIEKKGTKYYMQLTSSSLNKSIKTKIKADESEKIFSLLDEYDFPLKGNFFKDTTRTYYNTELLADSNWVFVNGDSIRIELMELIPIKGYSYDKKLKKCYSELGKCIIWTDGTTYDGEYTTPITVKKYSVYCSRISEKDYKLNLLIAELIRKYDKEKAFTRLIKEIESDRPTQYY